MPPLKLTAQPAKYKKKISCTKRYLVEIRALQIESNALPGILYIKGKILSLRISSKVQDTR